MIKSSNEANSRVGAAHVDTFTWIRQPLAAFTLAEVLVTLGIIGVVAAMTIPSLISRYKTFVLQQQFKKVYAALSVAVQKTQFDLGENVKCHYGVNVDWTDCSYFYQELVKQLNVIQTCEGDALKKGCLSSDYTLSEEAYQKFSGKNDVTEAKKYYNNNCKGFMSERIAKNNTVYVLNGGFILMPYDNGSNIGPLFLVDINGKSGPNKWGHDLFSLRFLKKKANDSYFTLAEECGCEPVEKGGFKAVEFMNRAFRGTADF